MPNIAHGDFSAGATTTFRKNFDYEYPEGLDLHPNSKLHKKLVTKILQRANDSHLSISKRYDSWNEVDHKLNAYIVTSDVEKNAKQKDKRNPVSIVFPYSYAILDTLLTYMVAAFYQEPIFQYEGVSAEDTIGAIMMEKVIDLHCNKFKAILNLHTMFRDSLAYGLGFCAPSWETVYGYKQVKTKRKRIFGSDIIGRETIETILLEGNALSNIDPYHALPDPNVPAHEIQKGEFFGWLEKTNMMDLLAEERTNENIFNVKYLKAEVQNLKTSVFGQDKSGREAKFGGAKVRDGNSTNPTDIIHMIIKLVPKDWNLGDGEYPENWYFQLASDAVIVMAKPVDLDHGMIPAVGCAPDFDGYSSTPISRLETLFGLQHTLDWMFNAHIANVRRAVNDTFVFDPYQINSNDLKGDRAHGGLIRTRRPMWGKGVKDSIMQLPVQDVTRGHVADSSWIVNWMQKIGAADDSTMGSLRQGGPERLTGKEFEGTQAMSFSRLKRIAQLVGVQSMQDIGTMFASHTQQLMSEDLYVKTTGESQALLQRIYQNKPSMKVTPFDVLVNYDLKVRDGSIPGSNFSGVWMKLFEVMATNPELQQRFDIARVFKHIAVNNGAKNVENFEINQAGAAPDQIVADQVQKGNLAPVQEVM